MTQTRPVEARLDRDARSTGGGATRISRWQMVVGAIGLVVVVWVGLDSPLVDAWFTDGPAEMDHGPGGDRPVEDVDRTPGSEVPDAGESDHAPMEHGSGGVG